MVKDLPANARDASLIPRSGTSPGVGNGNPLLYSCLEHPMGREAWRATSPQGSKETTKRGSTSKMKLIITHSGPTAHARSR